ncbi:hypothetical protein PVAP13_5KG044500 [Panicum virgatum]|uniref:Uncharacterized protein n=1 Tax=Panicum virgatum TaxID=38727 RepID=A0A8T0S9N0_PANVG|nr:hypothetical protein PVAP13_5KG044500 [Panicum virgatum]
MIYRQLDSRCTVPPPITDGAMDPMLQQPQFAPRSPKSTLDRKSSRRRCPNLPYFHPLPTKSQQRWQPCFGRRMVHRRPYLRRCPKLPGHPKVNWHLLRHSKHYGPVHHGSTSSSMDACCNFRSVRMVTF